MERSDADSLVTKILDVNLSPITLKSLAEEVIHAMGGMREFALLVVDQLNSAPEGGQARNHIISTLINAMARSEATDKDQSSLESRLSDQELTETIGHLLREIDEENEDAPATAVEAE